MIWDVHPGSWIRICFPHSSPNPDPQHCNKYSLFLLKTSSFLLYRILLISATLPRMRRRRVNPPSSLPPPPSLQHPAFRSQSGNLICKPVSGFFSLGNSLKKLRINQQTLAKLPSAFGSLWLRGKAEERFVSQMEKLCTELVTRYREKGVWSSLLNFNFYSTVETNSLKSTLLSIDE